MQNIHIATKYDLRESKYTNDVKIEDISAHVLGDHMTRYYDADVFLYFDGENIKVLKNRTGRTEEQLYDMCKAFYGK